MKNILLLIISCFLFTTISYAQYDDSSSDYEPADTSYEQPQDYETAPEPENYESASDRVEDYSANAEEDTSYQNF